MEFFGNDNDPMAKTLKDLKENTSESHLGNAGDFFTPVHERDRHVKPPQNVQNDVLEFNAALLTVDDSTTMLEYIILRNKITEESCYIVEETSTVSKDTGETTVFIKWFQPKGLFELGTAKYNPTYKLKNKNKNKNKKDRTTDKSPELKNKKEKGSRKFNKKVKL